jgi:protein-L-isoaspartate(D-aspartate) O-methyltransferase
MQILFRFLKRAPTPGGCLARPGILFASLVLALSFSGIAPCVRAQDDEEFARKRLVMVEEQVAARGVRDPAVLEALKSVPRHLFVPPGLRDQAYDDGPLPIGEGQTISQPYIVGLMTQSLGLGKGEKVLEVGTGSGYQAAVLARLAGAVFSIEINETLARRAADTLKNLGFANVRVRSGDGFFGWSEEAPYNAIIVTCAVGRLPPPLLEQLAEGGRLILPLGEAQFFQTLTLITKKNGKPVVREIIDVRFVPMTGEALKKKRAN